MTDTKSQESKPTVKKKRPMPSGFGFRSIFSSSSYDGQKISLDQYLRILSALREKIINARSLGGFKGSELSELLNEHLNEFFPLDEDRVSYSSEDLSQLVDSIVAEQKSDDIETFISELLTPFIIRLGGISVMYDFVRDMITDVKQDWDILPFLLNSDGSKYRDVDGVWVVSGVNLIIGGADAGKSPLARRLCSGDESSFEVRVHEPHSGYGVNTKRALLILYKHLLRGTENIVIDSVKNLLSSGGNAMKGGLSLEAFVDISNLSTIAILTGSRLFVPLNPGSSDSEVMLNAVQAGKSHASSTIWNTKDQDWSTLSRGGENMKRSRVDFTFGYDGKLVITKSSIEPGSVKQRLLPKRPDQFLATGIPADPDASFMKREIKLRGKEKPTSNASARTLADDSDLD